MRLELVLTSLSLIFITFFFLIAFFFFFLNTRWLLESITEDRKIAASAFEPVPLPLLLRCETRTFQ